MEGFTELDRPERLERIKAQETKINGLQATIEAAKFELQEMKRINAIGLNIQWQDSVKWCMELNTDVPAYFIKTPAFFSECIAIKHGVEITRDMKNKISTTLSVMFNKGLAGRIEKGTQTYYGSPTFFKKDKEGRLTELKSMYKEWSNKLY